MKKESVWDYPRPPKMELAERRARLQFDGCWIADSQRAIRVLETSHPPTYYIPMDDIEMELLVPVPGYETVCEWKGQASYYDIEVGDQKSAKAGWTYRNPLPAYEELKDHIAFYPARLDACFLDDELVQAQEGSFYGGWITAEIEGPFKGGAGTMGW